ncbi:MAG: PEP-CTERM sorting domain-containing protein [Salinisphaera sp.]|jgi:hypothetical protein|nr:PEP-CTERM sorting domain-containing protein [Salinisphaera sp.]
MRRRPSIRFFSVAFALTVATSANATTINFNSTPNSNGVPMTNVVGATTVDFDSGCGYAGCTGNYAIVSGSQSGRYAAPATGSGADSTPYLSIPKNGGSGSATFALGSTANYFGLLWGSVDDYNSIDFLLGNTVVDSYTGSDVITPNAANGNQLAPSTNVFVNFMEVPLFDAVRLSSTQYAFESDNHAFGLIGDTADVPEPGNLLLFGLGLAGLFYARRRRSLG